MKAALLNCSRVTVTSSFLIGAGIIGLSPLGATETYRPEVLFAMKAPVFGPPADMAVDADENFYLLSPSKSIVHIYDRKGERISFFNWEGAPKPHIRLDDQGNIHISSTVAGKTWVYDRNGQLLKKLGLEPTVDEAGLVSFPDLNEYHFVKVLARDKAGNSYVLYRFKRDEAIYHFQVSNTEDNPPYRTYKFDPNQKCLCSFDSPILFNVETQNVYGFRSSDDRVEFLKWTPFP